MIVFNLFFNYLSNLWIKGLTHEDVIHNVAISGDQTSSNNTEIPSNTVEELSGETVEEYIEETSGEETSEE